MAICPNCNSIIEIEDKDPTRIESISIFTKINKTFKEYIKFMNNNHHSIPNDLILKKLENDFNIYSKETIELIQHIYYWFNGEKVTIKYGFIFNSNIYYIHPFMLDINAPNK